ncbi:tyrosine-type recombinase/integrase [Clostridium sp.]|uniref:tyrosine-type recombinase/integrase n=1 Tax=Clostridium sp. TaxID=1506 RepID=UPI002622767E|nr:tyrosine-type recombinase/integrase [Clostridium sp.]
MDLDYNIIKREKDGGLQVIISYKDINGKWRQKSKQGFKGKKADKLADNWANDAITDLKNNFSINRGYENITLIEFYKLFIKDRENTLRPLTLKGYEDSIKHFKVLYDIRLKDIKTIDIQREFNNLNKLNSSSIEAYLKKIKCLFNFAVNKYEIIQKSPVRNIEYTGNKTEEKTALNNIELNKLLNDLKGLRTYRPFIASLLASKCGLRIGEICGLTWKDIDFTNNNIDINKQWIKDQEGIWGFGKLKTDNSYRIVPMPPIVHKELLKLKESNPLYINMRILNVKNTTAFSSDLIIRYKKFEFDISVHELRHTYATNLISKGIDFKTAAKLLGHDIKETMKTYSHVNDDMFKNAKNIIDKFF